MNFEQMSRSVRSRLLIVERGPGVGPHCRVGPDASRHPADQLAAPYRSAVVEDHKRSRPLALPGGRGGATGANGWGAESGRGCVSDPPPPVGEGTGGAPADLCPPAGRRARRAATAADRPDRPASLRPSPGRCFLAQRPARGGVMRAAVWRPKHPRTASKTARAGRRAMCAPTAAARGAWRRWNAPCSFTIDPGGSAPVSLAGARPPGRRAPFGRRPPLPARWPFHPSAAAGVFPGPFCRLPDTAASGPATSEVER